MVLLHAPASGGGGIQRYSRELADALRAAGEDVRELRIRPWRLRVAGREFGGLASVRLKSLVRPLSKRDVLHSTFHYAAHPRCDVATVHDRFQETLAPLLGVSAGDVRRLHATLARLARRRVHLVCDSQATRRSVLDAGAGVRDELAHVVHPGVGDAFRPPVQEPPDDGLVHVLCVADLNPRKRVEWLLEAAARVGDDRLRVQWVGSRHAPRPAWAAVARRVEAAAARLGARLEASGPVGEAALVEAYQRAHLVVQPSVDEGFGYPPVEALACGTPVAVADRPVFREVLGDEASYFSGVDSLAATLERALRQPRPTPGERARRHAWTKARYAWPVSVRGMRQVYALARPEGQSPANSAGPVT